MKKTISLILTAVLLLSMSMFAMSADAADENGFKEGDTVYLDFTEYTAWGNATPVIYINFTDAVKEPNTSVLIETADASKFAPVTGAEKIGSYVYKYVMTSQDEGKKVFRFWRGNSEYLWNYSVTLSYSDYLAGNNAVKVTGKNGVGSVFAYSQSDNTESTEETQPQQSGLISAFCSSSIFIHGVKSEQSDTEAWVGWKDHSGGKYFYMPSSVKIGDTLEIYNTFSEDAYIITGSQQTLLPGGEITAVDITSDSAQIKAGGRTYSCSFIFSSGEAAVFVNNTDRSLTGNTDMWSYLTSDKDNYVSATAAVTACDGSVILEDVKKMKGRGNTSWNNTGNPKFGWNLTFNSAISLAGMNKCKKFSLIPNFQDASLCRNRFLYDLGDETGIPYASDSRFMDFYVNGEYKGAYMMAEKIECGNNALMSDINEDDYLNYIAGTQDAFQFCIEVGGAGADDDEIGFNSNSNTVAVKYPGIGPDDENASEVSSFVKARFSELYSALRNSSTVENYVDIDSMAKIYLINEFGKNWDGGSSSVYFVYKQDTDGTWKWFASPVWDYDNSLGNCNGVSGNLRNWGVTDYNLPSGWFISKKDKSNLYKIASNNAVIKEQIYRVWFEEFVPAINTFTDKTGVSEGELWSNDVYYSYLEDQAEMNYIVSPMIVNTSWISDHSSLSVYSANYTYDDSGFINSVSLTGSTDKSYDQYSFEGEYDYMLDWARTRAAWISNEYIDAYNTLEHEIPTEPETEPETQAEPDPDPELDLTGSVAFWKFDSQGRVPGDKLTEYGNADEGYSAVSGSGTLTLSVDGSKNRALEWSSVEYGTQGANMVPVMAAGTKNQWFLNGTPYIQLSDIDASDYTDLKITMYMAGSKKAPANWKLQYSADGTEFTDAAGTAVVLEADRRKILTAYLDKTMLPDETALKKSLTLRLVPTDKTTVSGGSTDDDPTGGEIALNYILLQGTKTEGAALRGDANGDGEVSVTDVTAVQRHAAGISMLEGQGLENASIDDGEVTVNVATLIQRYVADLISEI